MLKSRIYAFFLNRAKRCFVKIIFRNNCKLYAGFKPIEGLTLEDCFHIGQVAYSNKDYYHCVIWMRQISGTEDFSKLSFSKFDVFDHLAFCLAKVIHDDGFWKIILLRL